MAVVYERTIVTVAVKIGDEEMLWTFIFLGYYLLFSNILAVNICNNAVAGVIFFDVTYFFDVTSTIFIFQMKRIGCFFFSMCFIFSRFLEYLGWNRC